MPPLNLEVVPYPGLAVHALAATFAQPLGDAPTPAWLLELLRVGAPAPVQTSDALRTAVRDLLRVHGYRPTGRGKPSSEYLANAVPEGKLGAINAAVDAGNVASLHSGLPISVVDLDRTRGALRIVVPPPGSSYVFNRSGQTIDVAGLVSLADDDGPCANAVKDAQRTKTSPETRRVLAMVWGSAAPDPAHAPRTAAWLRDLLVRLGASVEPVAGASP
jgi:DNA/RNA-binding domain of Phe-tRNA-synthetase-like protein